MNNSAYKYTFSKVNEAERLEDGNIDLPYDFQMKNYANTFSVFFLKKFLWLKKKLVINYILSSTFGASNPPSRWLFYLDTITIGIKNNNFNNDQNIFNKNDFLY